MGYITPADFEDRVKEIIKACKNGEYGIMEAAELVGEMVESILIAHGYEAGMSCFNKFIEERRTK